MVPVGRTFCRPILFVIPLVINNPASQSSDLLFTPIIIGRIGLNSVLLPL